MDTLELDTHVLAWLYAGDRSRFPDRALKVLEANTLSCSPMAVLELSYLFEIGRISVPAHEVVAYLQERLQLAINDTRFSTVISCANALTWTRDPFDRIIVATADAQSSPLLTKDRTILAHYPGAIWD